jgi:hypothetical protein
LYSNNNNHSIFLDQKAPPGFASNGFISSQNSHDALSSSIQRHFPDSSNGSSGGGGGLTGSFDRQTIGENLMRSRSAAPSFDGGFSMGPPPGLSRRETPLASNRSSAIGNDSYLESSMDRSHILQLGQRRPASTGVIGGSQSSSSYAGVDSLGLGGGGGGGGGAVRPAAKTLMDLIQEDFPPESPVDAGDLYGMDFQRDQVFALERPRTTSPLNSSQYTGMMRGGDQFMYGRGGGGGFDDPHELGGRVAQGDNDILDSLDQLRLGIGDSSYPPNAMVSLSTSTTWNFY